MAEKELFKQLVASPGATEIIGEAIGATLRWVLGGLVTLMGYIHIASGRRVSAAEKRLNKELNKKSNQETCIAHRGHIDTVMGNLKGEIKEDICRIERAQEAVAKSTHGRLDKIYELLGGKK